MAPGLRRGVLSDSLSLFVPHAIAANPQTSCACARLGSRCHVTDRCPHLGAPASRLSLTNWLPRGLYPLRLVLLQRDPSVATAISRSSYDPVTGRRLRPAHCLARSRKARTSPRADWSRCTARQTRGRCRLHRTGSRRRSSRPPRPRARAGTR